MGPQQGRAGRCLSLKPGKALGLERRQQQEHLAEGRGCRRKNAGRKVPARARTEESKALAVPINTASQGAGSGPGEERAT